jgi:hypothetical protein
MPFILFWVLIFLIRGELGLKKVLECSAIWTIFLICFIMLSISPYIFSALQSVFDIILILMLFGSDIKLRP